MKAGQPALVVRVHGKTCGTASVGGFGTWYTW